MLTSKYVAIPPTHFFLTLHEAELAFSSEGVNFSYGKGIFALLSFKPKIRERRVEILVATPAITWEKPNQLSLENAIPKIEVATWKKELKGFQFQPSTPRGTWQRISDVYFSSESLGSHRDWGRRQHWNIVSLIESFHPRAHWESPNTVADEGDFPGRSDDDEVGNMAFMGHAQFLHAHIMDFSWQYSLGSGGDEESKVWVKMIFSTGKALAHVAAQVGPTTALSQKISFMESTQVSIVPILEIADYETSVIVPTGIPSTLLTLLGWYIAGSAAAYPEEWLPKDGIHFDFTLRLAMAIVVIACPYALGLATPPAITVTGVGASNGVLVKVGDALERAQGVKCVIFDKTCILTQGKVTITTVNVLIRWMNCYSLLILQNYSTRTGYEGKGLEPSCFKLWNPGNRC